jgi:hypothetical protein
MYRLVRIDAGVTKTLRTAFALSNLWMTRKRLLAMTGGLRLKAA